MKEASQGREEPNHLRESPTEAGFSLMLWGILEYEEYLAILTYVKRADFHTPAPISPSPRMVHMGEEYKILASVAPDKEAPGAQGKPSKQEPQGHIGGAKALQSQER